MNYKEVGGALPASFLIMAVATVQWVALVEDVEFRAVPTMATIKERLPDGQIVNRTLACLEIFARSDLPGKVDVSIDYNLLPSMKSVGPVRSMTAVDEQERMVLRVCPDNAHVDPSTLKVKRH